MDYSEISYSEVKSMDANGIVFRNGEKIIFSECCSERNKELYGDSKCVAERDTTAVPRYIEFFTPDKHTRIIFDKRGIFSERKNSREFIDFHLKINQFGFSTFDLS